MLSLEYTHWKIENDGGQERSSYPTVLAKTWNDDQPSQPLILPARQSSAMILYCVEHSKQTCVSLCTNYTWHRNHCI